MHNLARPMSLVLALHLCWNKLPIFLEASCPRNSHKHIHHLLLVPQWRVFSPIRLIIAGVCCIYFTQSIPFVSLSSSTSPLSSFSVFHSIPHFLVHSLFLPRFPPTLPLSPFSWRVISPTINSRIGHLKIIADNTLRRLIELGSRNMTSRHMSRSKNEILLVSDPTTLLDAYFFFLGPDMLQKCALRSSCAIWNGTDFEKSISYFSGAVVWCVSRSKL